MRPVWTGGISFGLIYIPVNLYTAVSPIEIDLDLLSKKDLDPIRYARIDKVTGKEVPWKDVVKGYEFKKGDYVVLDQADFDKIALHRSNTIEITSFVDKKSVDPIYYEKPYYLEPDKHAQKTYFILVEALKKSGKVGIAEFIFKNREHLCSISAEGNALVLNQMRYSSELRDVHELEIPKKMVIADKELNLATKLIEAMSDKFDPEEYTDDYIKSLKKIIDAKKSHKSVKVKKSNTPKPTDISKIINELEKSLQQYSVSKVK
jgi:DNA end-binding protein Ku